MSGLDKILDHITQEAREEADAILSAAREEADAFLTSGKADADQIAAAIAKQSDLDVAAAVKRIQSASELREKRILLQTKQDKIEEVFAEALQQLQQLPDDEYFAAIRKMIDRYAGGQSGEIRFNSRDLARLPRDLASKAAEYHLTIGTEPVDIAGGFILSYGDIEENCSFDVLISASREELQDRIGDLLFS